MVVGILALQGDFAEHGEVLDALGVRWQEVRIAEELSGCDALIIPGGESTTMTKLLSESGLDRELFHQIKSGLPVLGTCAGAILLSDSHLNLLDISVDRNAYGSQLQSFSAEVSLASGHVVKASFIRAPKITRTGDAVEVLSVYEDVPVLIKQGNVMAATFHTEVRGETALHQLFLAECASLRSMENVV